MVTFTPLGQRQLNSKRDQYKEKICQNKHLHIKAMIHIVMHSIPKEREYLVQLRVIFVPKVWSRVPSNITLV